MTNKNPKRPPGTYRAPSTNGSKEAAAPRPRGLGALLGARPPVDTAMPAIPAALLRGFVAIVSSPVLLAAIPLFLLVEWLAVVAMGFQGPFSVFTNALAIPPIGTIFDATIATGTYGAQAGLLFIVAFVAVRAVVLALLTVGIVQVLDEGKVSVSAMSRVLRVIPVTLSVGFLNMIIVTLSGVFLQLGGIGFLLQIAGMVLGVYLFVFAPIMAAVEPRGMTEAMSRSIRAARIPGAGNLLMSAIYVLPAIAVLLYSGKPGTLLAVNPTAGQWVFVLIANLIHLVVLATFAFRYLSIADDVPDAPPPRSRSQRRR